MKNFEWRDRACLNTHQVQQYNRVTKAVDRYIVRSAIESVHLLGGNECRDDRIFPFSGVFGEPFCYCGE